MNNSPTYECDPNQWVESYADELYSYAYYKVNNRELAEDLIQETFLSALDNLDKFRRDCAEKTWLYNILKNKIIDFYRKKKRQELKEDTHGNKTTEEAFYNKFFISDTYKDHWRKEVAPSEWTFSLDDKLEKEELMTILMMCLSFLPNQWEKIFRMKNMEDLSSSDICKELGITPSNLWVIIHRAKLQLRDCLEKNWIKA